MLVYMEESDEFSIWVFFPLMFIDLLLCVRNSYNIYKQHSKCLFRVYLSVKETVYIYTMWYQCGRKCIPWWGSNSRWEDTRKWCASRGSVSGRNNWAETERLENPARKRRTCRVLLWMRKGEFPGARVERRALWFGLVSQGEEEQMPAKRTPWQGV